MKGAQYYAVVDKGKKSKALTSTSRGKDGNRLKIHESKDELMGQTAAMQRILNLDNTCAAVRAMVERGWVDPSTLDKDNDDYAKNGTRPWLKSLLTSLRDLADENRKQAADDGSGAGSATGGP